LGRGAELGVRWAWIFAPGGGGEEGAWGCLFIILSGPIISPPIALVSICT